MSTSRRILVVVGVLLALAAVATTAYAAAPRAAAPTINGCVNKQTGVLRVATSSRPCFTRPGVLQETPIAWNLVDGGTPPPVTAGQPAQVQRRTVTQTIPAGSDLVLVKATCQSDETVVTGSWKANGEEPVGNRAVSYSLGDTGEHDNGYQVKAGPGFTYPNQPANTNPVTVSVTAVCLKIA